MGVVDWDAEIGRGALTPAVLAALASRPRHGYELLTLLRQHGFRRLQGGTLYPLLRRLEEQLLVSHEWDTSTAGPARKVVSITRLGTAELAEAQRAWDRTGQALRSLSSPDGEASP